MITKEEIKKMSTIARISITDKESEKFADDLNDMFAFINMINEKNFDGAEFTGFCGSESFFRQDKVIEPLRDSSFNGTKSIDISLL
ncbi:MAG: Glutamyl-tRNA(Gln) amidotransferase subunit C, chloroplastic/mitochondrial [Eubacteriales bacterium SKADARSKE-1]|nr:Glutamyl-tRNA(Gln) amidotransferase subunit C, chloroplastic/mitochondrial [Eubacteriales bacterium SKADARSKE-1]